MAIMGQQGGSFGMGGRNPNPMGMGFMGLGLRQPDPLASYKAKDGYLSQFTVDPTGVIKSKMGAQDFTLNGVTVDLKRLGAYEGTGGSISRVKMDNNGNLIGQVSYQVANPNFGKYVNRPSPYGGFWGGWSVIDDSKTTSKMEWVQLQGFQADMANASKSRGGNLPNDNNVYLRPDEGGLLAEVEAIWEGNNTFTAAYARQMMNPTQQPAGQRLSTRGGGRTATLGGAPTSSAAGSRAADDINLRNRKGTLLT